MRHLSLFFLCLAVSLYGTLSPAQQKPAASQPSKSMSSSLGLHAFPAKNQSAEQQQTDETACYNWAKEDTGFDPIAAGTSAPPERPAGPKGAGAKGAAGGAATGAAIGAIAGDAGKGAAVGAAAGGTRARRAKRRAEKQAEKTQEKAQAQKAAGVDNFRKAFSACMEGKGYSVK